MKNTVLPFLIIVIVSTALAAHEGETGKDGKYFTVMDIKGAYEFSFQGELVEIAEDKAKQFHMVDTTPGIVVLG